MGPLGSVLRALRRGWQRLRLRVWALGLWLRLRRHGARLTLDLAPGVEFYSLPHVEILPLGGPNGHLTLRIGERVKLGRALTLDIWAGGRNVLELGPRTTFQSYCRVQLHDGAIRFAGDVQVRDFSQIKSKGEVTVGQWSILSRDVVVHCTERISIGDRVGIGERTSLIDSEHRNDGTDDFFLERPVETAAIVVEANTLVLTNCIVLMGATIGRNAVVAAGALVRGGDYAPGWMFAGIPARPVKPLPGVDDR
jgi:acetyltransferase-like isoleucine patch superfamily enzyme